MVKKRIRKDGQSGQSVVEMIVTLFGFFTIAFMYVQVALSFGVANYIQYATFMASRALLSGGENRNAQETAASKVLSLMLTKDGRERFASIARAEGDGDPAGSTIGPTPRVVLGASGARKTAWEQGVTYTFKMRMYMLPLVKGAKTGEANQIELTSESWLGRDPSEEECLATLKSRADKAGVAKVLFDNGC